MIRWINLLIFYCCLLPFSQGQNIFDLENSRKFADYLYQSGQYGLASDEYERVIFMDPSDTLAILPLLSSYRYQKKYQIGVRRAFELLPEVQGIGKELVKEIFLLSLYAGNYNRGKIVIDNSTSLTDQDRRNYQLSLFLLQKDYQAAEAFMSKMEVPGNPFQEKLNDVVRAGSDISSRNPYLAAGMSALVPGTGKIYTKNWQDGLIALLFVATNAWQSYRGFEKDGIKSVYGWLFGSIGAGFYLGNIYGSFRSARKYNDVQQKKYYESIEKTVFNGI